jgi:hypothetical protein
MLTRFYLGWGALVCGLLVTADALGWTSPNLFPRGQALNAAPNGPGVSGPSWFPGSRGSGGSFGWGGGK